MQNPAMLSVVISARPDKCTRDLLEPQAPVGPCVANSSNMCTHPVLHVRLAATSRKDTIIPTLKVVLLLLLCCCCFLCTQSPADYASVMLKLQTIINGPASTSKVGMVGTSMRLCY